MNTNSQYYKQVRLLIEVLPLVAEENCFALKGGTAINLFERNLPRLSVDIDLVFLPMRGRDDALVEIKTALLRIKERISKTWKGVKVFEAFREKNDALRLIVFKDNVQIKIELSPVLRGTVFDPAIRAVCEAVEDEFGYVEIQVVHPADLYAGKICAALDRQHPRDLYDVQLLLQDNGFTNDLRKALIVYLISHPRPIAELLQPAIKDITHVFQSEFENMTEEEVRQSDLEQAFKDLIDTLNSDLTDNERKFLLSFKRKSPDWSLLGLQGIEKLPAVNWKLINLERMVPEKHQQAYEKLKNTLYSTE